MYIKHAKKFQSILIHISLVMRFPSISSFFANKRKGFDPQENLSFRVSPLRTLRDCAILAGTGAALTLAFPGMDVPMLQWIAAIPLIALCFNTTKKRAFWYGMIWGYFWNLTMTFFLREINIVLPFIFGAVLGIFCAFWSTLIPVFCRNVLYPAEVRAGGFREMNEYRIFRIRDEFHVIFALAIWWILLEWLRSWIFTGFPWGLLAASAWRNLPLIQMAEYTGIYGISFLIILVNLSLYFAGRRIVTGFIDKGRFLRPYPFYAVLFLVALAHMMGVYSMSYYAKLYRGADVTYYPIGVVQPDLSQRRSGGIESAREALDVCAGLSEHLIAENKVLEDIVSAGETVSPDTIPLKLIVWPETAVPESYYMNGTFCSEYRKKVRELMRESNLPFLIGTIMYRNIKSATDFEVYNSALLLKPTDLVTSSAQDDYVDSYDKIHIVPFGEFIPLNDKFPIIGEFVGMGRNLNRGKYFRPITLAEGISAGVQICYEDVFSYVNRNLVRNGANFLLVITNDAWYPTSTEPIQHYANSIFRAIETRMPMVRCGNSNYSVLVDALGRTIDAAGKRYNPETGTMELNPAEQAQHYARFEVPVLKDYKPTFYVIFGNLFIGICGAFFTLLAVESFRRHRAYCRAISQKPTEDTLPTESE